MDPRGYPTRGGLAAPSLLPPGRRSPGSDLRKPPRIFPRKPPGRAREDRAPRPIRPGAARRTAPPKAPPRKQDERPRLPREPSGIGSSPGRRGLCEAERPEKARDGPGSPRPREDEKARRRPLFSPPGKSARRAVWTPGGSGGPDQRGKKPAPGFTAPTGESRRTGSRRRVAGRSI
jgi:hypothetical protein